MKRVLVMLYSATDIEKISGITDVDELKESILTLVRDFDRKEREYKFEINIFNQQIKSLESKLFGRKTEKNYKDDDQISVFDLPASDLPISEETKETIVTSHTRKKRGRRSLPENLPRIEKKYAIFLK